MHVRGENQLQNGFPLFFVASLVTDFGALFNQGGSTGNKDGKILNKDRSTGN